RPQGDALDPAVHTENLYFPCGCGCNSNNMGSTWARDIGVSMCGGGRGRAIGAAYALRIRGAAAVVLLALGIGGCSLFPQPLTDPERQAEAVSDMTAIFGSQVPLKGALTLEQAFARALAYNLDQRS